MKKILREWFAGGGMNSTCTYSPAQPTKALLLHNIDSLAKIYVKIDRCELPKFLLVAKGK